MLILFDIDGTILSCPGAGRPAYLTAFAHVSGATPPEEGWRFAGSLDPLIWRDLCEVHQIDDGEEIHARFRALYVARLEENLRRPDALRVLPGAMELIASVDEHPELHLGVLTGNYPESGALKLRRAGLDPDAFVVAVWGDDGEHRRELPRVACQRFAVGTGRELAPEEVVVIGDTPKDVDCARANGHRSIAVATGTFSTEELEQAGADLTVESLGDTARLLEWIHAG